MEEYSLAKQFFRLSSGDLCELARNSVLQSGFPIADKALWLGSADPQHNEILKTNLPDARFRFREECHTEEMQLVLQDDANDAMTAFRQGIPRTISREDLSTDTPSPAPKRSKNMSGDSVVAVSNGVHAQEPHRSPAAPCPASPPKQASVGERLLRAVSSNPRTPLLDPATLLRLPGLAPEAAEEMELPPASPAWPQASQEFPPLSPAAEIVKSHSPKRSAMSVADPADHEAVLAAITGQRGWREADIVKHHRGAGS